MTWKRDAWKHDAWRRWGVALAAGLAAVAALALLAKALMQGFAVEYRIQWLATVPILALLVAVFLQRGWAQEARLGAPGRPAAPASPVLSSEEE